MLTKEQIPARAGLRLSCDIIEFCLERLPHWVPVSIAGYNGAETGLNAWEELGAVFANAVAYLDEVLARGRLTADALAHAIGGISLRTSMDLFEDAAKFRVARSMWHDLLRDRYGVQDERALRLRIHGLTSGAAMTYQQPLNNIVRGTVMALAAVLGGVQSLGVSAYDEAISIPSEHAHQLSVRIQQILQNECNLTAVVDPLGGSYYLEHLCGELEQRAWEFFREIEARGGFIATLDSGWLHERAHRRQVEREEALTSGAMRMVGVNCFEDGDDLIEPAGFEGTPDAWERAVERLGDLRRDRDEGQARAALARLEAVCRSKDNVMPAMMAAVQAGASIGEVGRVFREVFGIWDIPITF
ncbi:MAG: methylmalonyl-CoA mutase family protein [Dehalococcoidia bacterium]